MGRHRAAKARAEGGTLNRSPGQQHCLADLVERNSEQCTHPGCPDEAVCAYQPTEKATLDPRARLAVSNARQAILLRL
jgi:Rad3-related DNA helicase